MEIEAEQSLERWKESWMYLPKRELLELRRVQAFPKDSRRGVEERILGITEEEELVGGVWVEVESTWFSEREVR